MRHAWYRTTDHKTHLKDLLDLSCKVVILMNYINWQLSNQLISLPKMYS